MPVSASSTAAACPAAHVRLCPPPTVDMIHTCLKCFPSCCVLWYWVRAERGSGVGCRRGDDLGAAVRAADAPLHARQGLQLQLLHGLIRLMRPLAAASRPVGQGLGSALAAARLARTGAHSLMKSTFGGVQQPQGRTRQDCRFLPNAIMSGSDPYGRRVLLWCRVAFPASLVRLLFT